MLELWCFFNQIKSWVLKKNSVYNELSKKEHAFVKTLRFWNQNEILRGKGHSLIVLGEVRLIIKEKHLN